LPLGGIAFHFVYIARLRLGQVKGNGLIAPLFYIIEVNNRKSDDAQGDEKHFFSREHSGKVIDD